MAETVCPDKCEPYLKIVAAGRRDMRPYRPHQPHLELDQDRVADVVADRHTEPYTFLDA